MNGPADNTPACPVCGLSPQVRGCTPEKCATPKEPAPPSPSWCWGPQWCLGGASCTCAQPGGAPGVTYVDLRGQLLAFESPAARLRGMASDPRNAADMRTLVAAANAVDRHGRAVDLLRALLRYWNSLAVDDADVRAARAFLAEVDKP